MIVHIDPLKIIHFEKQNGRLKQNGRQNHKTDHNLLNFQARSSRFFMVVHIDLLKIIHFLKQNGSQITKLIITHSIFKPETPDIAW